MTGAPVLFLIFNRPEATARVFDAIRAARPGRLYVAADGPRLERVGEDELCSEARRIATEIDWQCETKTLFRDRNLGCRRAVDEAITWFFESESEGIILEDDCVPHPSFFSYCCELLDVYRDDERIMSICGVNFQQTMKEYAYSYYFSVYCHCWGWATWRRAWNLNDTQMVRYPEFLASGVLSGVSPQPGFEPFWRGRLEQAYASEIDTWDYAWLYSCWANSGLSIIPRVNLISNIGFGDGATHTNNAASPWAAMPVAGMDTPLRHPLIVSSNRDFDAYVSAAHFRIRPPRGPLRSLAWKFRRWLRRPARAA